jgi:predicted transcriptional regulator of viral defense system
MFTVLDETALQFYELADVNPVAVAITVPKQYRTGRAGGDAYSVRREDLAGNEIAVVEGVRVVSVNRAITRGDQSGGWNSAHQSGD